METVLVKANSNLSNQAKFGSNFNGEKGMSDREGHGHKPEVYKSHFPPLRQLLERHQQGYLALVYQ